MVWYGVVWCGMAWYGVVFLVCGGMGWYGIFGMWRYGMVWCGLVWFSVVWWFGVVWKIASCQNRPPTRAPEIPYGAIGPELRCACDGIGVGCCGMVYCGVVWY